MGHTWKPGHIAAMWLPPAADTGLDPVNRGILDAMKGIDVCISKALQKSLTSTCWPTPLEKDADVYVGAAEHFIITGLTSLGHQ